MRVTQAPRAIAPTTQIPKGNAWVGVPNSTKGSTTKRFCQTKSVKMPRIPMIKTPRDVDIMISCNRPLLAL
jgi:hypothetical protein